MNKLYTFFPFCIHPLFNIWKFEINTLSLFCSFKLANCNINNDSTCGSLYVHSLKTIRNTKKREKMEHSYREKRRRNRHKRYVHSSLCIAHLLWGREISFYNFANICTHVNYIIKWFLSHFSEKLKINVRSCRQLFIILCFCKFHLWKVYVMGFK